MDLLLRAIDLGFKNSKTLKYDKYILLCEIQRWLREIHKINIFIWESIDDKYSALVRKDKEILFETHLGHKTYEEALEIGLHEALKLVNNK